MGKDMRGQEGGRGTWEGGEGREQSKKGRGKEEEGQEGMRRGKGEREGNLAATVISKSGCLWCKSEYE